MQTVLVAVAGLTPQVVTETLYCLVNRGELPREIHVLTTLPGRQKVRERLLDPHTGAFYTFCSEYGIDHRRIRFDTSTIHVLTDGVGRPIEDLRTAEENAAMADQIASFVRSLAERPDVRIHASLAGGRKTMTFYLGYALSLFGREHDRLSHVLVSPDFETHEDFFYPPRKPRQLKTRAEKWIDTSEAKVDLVEIPFVRLRDHLPVGALEGSFEELIRRAQEALDTACRPPEVRIDLAAKRIICAGFECRLTDQLFALWVHFALARRAGKRFLSFDDLVGEDLMDELWSDVGRGLGLGSAPDFNRLPELVDRFATTKGPGDRNFASVVSKINRALRSRFPASIAEALSIRSEGRSPVRYGLRVEAGRISFSAGQQG